MAPRKAFTYPDHRFTEDARVMRWAARPVGVLVGVVAVMTAGCGGSAPAPRHSPATLAPVPSSAPSSGNPQQQARQAYLGMWQAYVTAARTADYQAPGLDHYAAGGALSTLTHALYQEHQDAEVSLGQPVLHPAVTLVKGSGGDVTQADVTDCADGSHWLNYHGGKLIAGQDVRSRHIIARLQPFNGTWKVTYLNVGLAGTC
jgi:hypothetical protein